MRIGLIVAMDKEFCAIADSWKSKDIERRHIMEKNGCRYMLLQPTETDEVIMLQCGIGKVNGALGAMTLMELGVDCIISSGVAGSSSALVDTGAVVVGKYYQYHDVYCGKEVKRGVVQGELSHFTADEGLYDIAMTMESAKFIYGTIVTGDQFVDDANKMMDVNDICPDNIAVDMESCAIAQVCHKCKKPFISFRIISDSILNPNAKKYSDFWESAPLEMASNVMRYIMKVIREYKPF